MKKTKKIHSVMLGIAFCLACHHITFSQPFKLVPLYDKTKLSFSGVRTIWMEEVPTLPKHFWVLGQAGTVHTLYPNSKGEYDASSKKMILDFTKDALFILKSEYGAYAMSFHPNFPKDPRAFVVYTAKEFPTSPPDQRGGLIKIDEYKVSGEKFDNLVKTRNIITSKHGNTFGTSTITFGADGYLYAFLGDYNISSQDLEQLNRKILRIDIDKSDPNKNYAIPSDNPFVNNANPKIRKEIWAYGFRNTWRLTVDPLTGDLWGSDVGTFDPYEEMNLIQKGKNYGWETGGNYIQKGFTGPCKLSNTKDCTPFTDPEWSYPRASGSGSKPGVIGMDCIGAGVIYRANRESPLYGQHIYFDVASDIIVAHEKGKPPKVIGDVKSLGGTGGSGHNGISHLSEGAYGEIYATLITWDLNSYHEIYKVSHPDLGPSNTPVNILMAQSRHRAQSARSLALVVDLQKAGSGIFIRDESRGRSYTLDGHRVSQP